MKLWISATWAKEYWSGLRPGGKREAASCTQGVRRENEVGMC